jgi:hypothetical protein
MDFTIASTAALEFTGYVASPVYKEAHFLRYRAHHHLQWDQTALVTRTLLVVLVIPN